ncbi:MAG TPA: cupin domain-containing protein [Candidatus Saccharimonadales bacterium]|nr:cupin domain-containing protein [Candidatus Saccharimonadales bacterium]
MSMKVFNLNTVQAKTILGGPIKLVTTNTEDGTKNQLVAFGVFKPGEGLYPHLHPKSEEIYYVVKGQGTIFVKDQKTQMLIKANEIIYIPANTPHCVTNTGNDELLIAFIMTPGLTPAQYKIAEDTKLLEEKIIK